MFIFQEEFTNTTFLNYYRTVEELSEPFNNSESNVAKAGLKLCHIDTKVVKCPYNQQWKEQRGDPQKHAEWYIPTTRTWSNHTFFSGKCLLFPYQYINAIMFTFESSLYRCKDTFSISRSLISVFMYICFKSFSSFKIIFYLLTHYFQIPYNL